MGLLFSIGLGIYMSGHGIRGIANGALIGSILMILGGIFVIMDIAI